MSNHFQTEENEMRSKYYDGLENHVEEHKELFQKLTSAAALFDDEENGVEGIVLEFFFKWFLHHVSTSDRKFSEFLLSSKTA